MRVAVHGRRSKTAAACGRNTWGHNATLLEKSKNLSEREWKAIQARLEQRKKSLALFHHKMHNSGMKVVEKDKVISGMLRDELKRCREILASLQKSAAGLPKGVLNERKKRYKEKAYSYLYLKYRDGEKVVNKHIPNDEAPGLLKKLEQRKKLEKEARAYKYKINYLMKILKSGKG